MYVVFVLIVAVIAAVLVAVDDNGVAASAAALANFDFTHTQTDTQIHFMNLFAGRKDNQLPHCPLRAFVCQFLLRVCFWRKLRYIIPCERNTTQLIHALSFFRYKGSTCPRRFDALDFLFLQVSSVGVAEPRPWQSVLKWAGLDGVPGVPEAKNG